jgi:hypothetical protein
MRTRLKKKKGRRVFEVLAGAWGRKEGGALNASSILFPFTQ